VKSLFGKGVLNSTSSKIQLSDWIWDWIGLSGFKKNKNKWLDGWIISDDERGRQKINVQVCLHINCPYRTENMSELVML